MENARTTAHLTDDELFALALPPAGEPEALPPHLLACAACGRALQEWKRGVRDIGSEEVEPISRRSAAEWRAAEDRTLERLRRQGLRRRRRVPAWAVGLAAAVLVALVLLPERSERRTDETASAPAPASDLTGQDAADDVLLREVARLARSDDAAPWEGLVPDPSESGERKM